MKSACRRFLPQRSAKKAQRNNLKKGLCSSEYEPQPNNKAPAFFKYAKEKAEAFSLQFNPPRGFEFLERTEPSTLQGILNPWRVLLSCFSRSWTASQRIESQLLQTQIALADESIKLEQSRALPVVGADGSLGFTPAANDIGNIFQGERWRPFSYIGVNVGIPIFNGMDVKRAVNQQKLVALQSRDYLDQFTIQFESEKATTRVQIQKAMQRFSYADANLKLANNNIELLHEAFVNGVADNQDMILGENDLYDNQARYFNELLQLMLSEIEGQRVVGLFNKLAGLEGD